jgi:hypothetical protein
MMVLIIKYKFFTQLADTLRMFYIFDCFEAKNFLSSHQEFKKFSKHLEFKLQTIFLFESFSHIKLTPTSRHTGRESVQLHQPVFKTAQLRGCRQYFLAYVHHLPIHRV